MTKERIWLSPPHMSGEEIKYVQEAFNTNWIAPVGPHLTAFEKELSEYNNISHCAVLSSGTAAIQLALIVLGVQQGDEVICSTFTFVGSCNPILYLSAHPVFIDSEYDTWNMDPVLLEEAVLDRIKKGKKPKAIIIVHLYGMPAKMDEIMTIANRYEIPVIEDAAEGIGSTYKGRKLGTIGQIGVFSFNGNKIITTSGGGALVSNNKEWVDHVRFLSTQARDQAIHYEHSVIGYNYRLSNVCAGIGRGQLRVLDLRVKQRRSNFDLYLNQLGKIEGLEFVKEPKGFFSNRWLTTLLFSSLPTREKIRLGLEKENIESRPLWKPMHLQPVFKGLPYYGGKVSETMFERGLCLPSGSNLLQPDQESIIDLIKSMVTEI